MACSQESDTMLGNLTEEEAREKVSALYFKGNNCDKACLLVIQEMLGLPEKEIDFVGYQLVLSDSSEFTFCKGLTAGAAAIALDIIDKSKGNLQAKRAMEQYSDRVNHLINEFESRFRYFYCSKLLGFDPFKYDDYPEEIQEEIEQGDWMNKCCEYMQFVVGSFYDSGQNS